MLYLATSYEGLLGGLAWFAVNGVYLIMLLITAIGCLGRRYTRGNDDLTRSLVLGGIVLVLSVAYLAWDMVGRPDWKTVASAAGISGFMWCCACLLRRYVTR